MKKIVGLATGLMAAAVALGGVSSASAATEMRCSHQLPPAHHIAKIIDQWAAEIETLSEGEIDVQVFGANSLTGAKQNATAVAKGDIDCAFSINPQWGKTLPLMNVTLGPFAVSSLNSLKKWDGSEAAQFLEEKLMTKGVKNVTWLFTTRSTAITSSGKALIKPADFEQRVYLFYGGKADYYANTNNINEAIKYLDLALNTVNNQLEKVTTLQNQLFPNQSLQERNTNFADLYLEYGEELIIALKKNLNPLLPEFTTLTF